MSKVEVDQVTQQSGTTLTVGGGACKTAVVDATTVTLGRCGGTVSLASGATQSGFGRSGSVNWQTTPKTTTFTPVNGEGYFINSGSSLTMNLPAGTAGAIVAVSDYARNFSTYPLTVSPNGTEKIGGVAADGVLNIDGQAATFIYVDSTKGWINVQNAEDTETGASYMSATVSGACNTLTTAPDCANVKIATFLNPGTFCVSSISNCATNNQVSYVVVAGGGGGGAGGSPGYGRGGGGAGGFREYKSPSSPYTASPLDGAPTITVTATAYPIQVGGGGAGSDPGGPTTTKGTPGCNSTFSTVISAGGGGGAAFNPPGADDGGSGGGASDAPYPGVPFAGGSGNTPLLTPSQGNDGGSTGPTVTPAGGGGGGATAAGQAGGTSSPHFGGTGGAGATTSISGSPTAYAGGGGGGGCSSGDPSGAPGGAGGGGSGGGAPPFVATAGTANTGGGGGGATWSAGAPGGGKSGGSGIVIIRYRFQ